ncbi:MAG: PH domain-containing protein [Bacteroidales bacterium]|nr:PH domain-containing protein [Bacteroidales bacterium]
MKALNHFLEPGEEIIAYLRSGGFKNWIFGLTSKHNVILAKRALFFKPKGYEFKVPFKEIKYFDYVYRPFTIEFQFKKGSDKYTLNCAETVIKYDKIIDFLNFQHVEAYPSYMNGEKLQMVIPIKGKKGRQTLKITNESFCFTELTKMGDENEITCVERFRFDELKYFDILGPWGPNALYSLYIATPQKDDKYKTTNNALPTIFISFQPALDIDKFFVQEEVFYDIDRSNVETATKVFYDPMYKFLRYIHEKFTQSKPSYLEADEVVMLDLESRKEFSIGVTEPSTFIRLTNKRVLELNFDKNQNKFLPINSWVYDNFERVEITKIHKDGRLENIKIEFLFKDGAKKIFYNDSENLVNICSNMIVSKIKNQEKQ